MWWNQIRSTGIQIFIIDPETKRFADAVFFLNQLRTAETRGAFYRTAITFNYTTAKIIEWQLPFLRAQRTLARDTIPFHREKEKES